MYSIVVKYSSSSSRCHPARPVNDSEDNCVMLSFCRISVFAFSHLFLSAQAWAPGNMYGYDSTLGSLSQLRRSPLSASCSAQLFVLRGSKIHRGKSRLCSTIDSSPPADHTSALFTAIMDSNATLVDILLQQGANPTSFDDWGVSCLQLAVKNGEEGIARSLVRAGVDVNMSDRDGDTTTPLHMAAQRGHLGIVQLLVKNGADVNRKDAFGCSVLKVAAMAKKNSDEITAFLQPYVTEEEEPGPIDLKSTNLGSRQLSKAEADALLDQNADWEAAERGEEGSEGSVVQIVTDPATGARTIRRIPLKSEFMKDLEKRRKKAA